MVDTESINPGANKYIEKIEFRLNKKARLAHDIGAGAPCLKCEDKCSGFQLHYWRKVCLNCRCSKDDHDIQDDDEDIGHFIIGKLFNRSDPLERDVKTGGKMLESSASSQKPGPPGRKKKKELAITTLDLPSDEGGGGASATPQQFEWVPPNIELQLAARYMTALPPEKRPIAGSQAAKDRRVQLGQQIPLYDMDETRRCEAMPTNELQQFKAHLDHVRSNVVGQGIVSEIQLAPKLLVEKLPYGGVGGHQEIDPLDSSGEQFGQEQARSGQPLLVGKSLPSFHVRDNTKLRQEGLPFNSTNNNNGSPSEELWPQPPSPLDYGYDPNSAHFQQLFTSAEFNARNNNAGSNSGIGPRASFIGDMLGAGGRFPDSAREDALSTKMEGLQVNANDPNSNYPWGEAGASAAGSLAGHSNLSGLASSGPGSARGPYSTSSLLTSPRRASAGGGSSLGSPIPGAAALPRPYSATSDAGVRPVMGTQSSHPTGFAPQTPSSEYSSQGASLMSNAQRPSSSLNNLSPTPYGGTSMGSPKKLSPASALSAAAFNARIDPLTGAPRPYSSIASVPPGTEGSQHSRGPYDPSQGSALHTPVKGSMSYNPFVGQGRVLVPHGVHSSASPPGGGGPNVTTPGYGGVAGGPGCSPHGGLMDANLMRATPGAVVESLHQQTCVEPYRERLTGSQFLPSSSDVTVLFPSGDSAPLSARGHQVPPGPGVGEAGVGAASRHDCEQCKNPMMAGEVAVICERAGPQKYWHPGCFVCHECGELLADMIYFWHGDRVYCGRHYHQAASVPRCHACDELIFSDSWTRAEDHDWHLPHFTCFMCDKQLAGESYVPSEAGQPYCLPCHMITQAQTCESCERKIEPGAKQCKFRDYHFHASDECFCCHSCRRPLLGGKFKLVKNWVFCSAQCVDSSIQEISQNPATKFKHGDEEKM